MWTEKKLEENKRKILNYLEKNKKSTFKIKKLERELKISRNELIKTLLHLEGLNDIKIIKSKEKIYKLSKNGEDYLDKFLPLEESLEILNNGSIKIEEFIEKIGNESIIGELKRRKWIKIQNKDNKKIIGLSEKGKKSYKCKINERKILNRLKDHNLNSNDLKNFEDSIEWLINQNILKSRTKEHNLIKDLTTDDKV